MNKNKHRTLYVLLLEQGKYYIGITSRTPEERFQGHLHGQKSYWTAAYPPVKIIDTVKLGDLDLESAKLYENRVTKRYMKEKGINNVRGGQFTSKNDFVLRLGLLIPKDDWNSILIVLALSVVVLYQAALLANR